MAITDDVGLTSGRSASVSARLYQNLIATIKQFLNIQRRAAVRSWTCFRESWSIGAEVWKIDRTVRKGLIALVIIHIIIAIIAAVFPVILAIILDLFQQKASLWKIVAVMVLMWALAQLTHGSWLEALRDFSAIILYRRRLYYLLSLRCLERKHAGQLTECTEIPNTLKEGRLKVLPLVEGFTRDPIFGLIGLFLTMYLCYTYPALGALVIVRIIAELSITFTMDDMLRSKFARRNRREIALHRAEMDILGNGSGRLARADRATQEKYYLRRLNHFCDTWRCVEVRRTLFENLGRDGLSVFFSVLTMIFIAWHVVYGGYTIGEYTMLVGIAETAVNPMRVIYTQQRTLMEERWKIQQLGRLTGINFKISPHFHE